MNTLEQLRQRYAQYEQELAEAKRAAPAGGYMGVGADPRRHPCNTAFYEDVKRWVTQFAAEEHSGQEVTEAVEWILSAANGRENDFAYGYLYAVQAHCKPLIPFLPDSERIRLRDWYDRTYPKHKRLPVQEDLYRQLCAGEAAPRRGIRRFLPGKD